MEDLSNDEDEPPPTSSKSKMCDVKHFCDGLHIYMPAWGEYSTRIEAVVEAKKRTNGRYRAKASRHGKKWYLYMSLDGRGGRT